MDNVMSVSGRKRLLSETDDTVLTPKKIRAQLPPTPTSKRVSTSASSSVPTRLLSSLQPLFAAYEAIEDSMIPALATSGVAAPVPDPTDPRKMCIKNVLHHLSVPGLSIETLKRLVYILEWEVERKPGSSQLAPSPLDDDPFGGGPMTPTKANKANKAATQWTRGGDSGIVISATTRLDHATGRRSPVYGIGIQMVTGKGKSKDFVLRWLDEADERKGAMEDKLRAWAEIQKKNAKNATRAPKGRSASPTPVQLPQVPFADLPLLTAPRTTLGFGTPSPVKRGLLFQTPVKLKASAASSVPFPTPEQTPVSNPPPTTPSPTKTAVDGSTPSTARRDALRERIRQKSLQNNGTPSKSRVAIIVSGSDGKAETKMISKEEMKRRCVLGRLDGIAECVASLFSQPQSGSTMGVNRRRIMKMDDVVRVVVKSSKSPISAAEAKESLEMLVELCPSFITSRVIDREPWLEMPTAVAAPLAMTSSPLKNAIPTTTASTSTSPVKPLATAFSLANPPSTPPRNAPSTPRKARPALAAPTSPTPSPGRRFIPSSPGGAMSREEIEDELLNRRPGEGSPRRIRQFMGVDGTKIMTLADVRERIQRELEKE